MFLLLIPAPARTLCPTILRDTNFRRLPLSPAVPRRLPPSPTVYHRLPPSTIRLSLLPQPRPSEKNLALPIQSLFNLYLIPT